MKERPDRPAPEHRDPGPLPEVGPWPPRWRLKLARAGWWLVRLAVLGAAIGLVVIVAGVAWQGIRAWLW